MNLLVTRRQALRTTLAAAATTLIAGRSFGQAAGAGPHTLPPLPFGFGALEPYIDAQTMQIHHDKHHAGYVANLNKALADYPDLAKWSVEDLLRKLDQVPERIRTAVRNNAGGHYNHSLFWQSLKVNNGATPSDTLGQALMEALDAGSGEEAQENFAKMAMGVFGSGWIWVTVTADKRLKMETTPNQDCPLSAGRTPLLGLDLWEHAYYLKYQNRRLDYVKAYLNVINWEFVEQRYRTLVG